jgi:hypothetical protein
MACRDIATLDLAPVRAVARSNHPDWPDAVLDDGVRRYRDFLSVCCYGAGHGTAQVAAVDALAHELWHAHLLLPARYLADCHTVFGSGSILDRYPGGTSGQPPVTLVDQKAALQLYDEAGIDRPVNIRSDCVWAIVNPHP